MSKGELALLIMLFLIFGCSFFLKERFYLPPQVIGCGGRREPCMGGPITPVVHIKPRIHVNEDRIAPMNIITGDPIGVPRRVGVLYKIFGETNEIYPLYGVKRYRNSDSWDYYTKVGDVGNWVTVRVLTRRRNNNELGTNDEVRLEGNSSKFRVTIYERDEFVPIL